MVLDLVFERRRFFGGVTGAGTFGGWSRWWPSSSLQPSSSLIIPFAMIFGCSGHELTDLTSSSLRNGASNAKHKREKRAATDRTEPKRPTPRRPLSYESRAQRTAFHPRPRPFAALKSGLKTARSAVGAPIRPDRAPVQPARAPRLPAPIPKTPSPAPRVPTAAPEHPASAPKRPTRAPVPPHRALDRPARAPVPPDRALRSAGPQPRNPAKIPGMRPKS